MEKSKNWEQVFYSKFLVGIAKNLILYIITHVNFRDFRGSYIMKIIHIKIALILICMLLYYQSLGGCNRCQMINIVHGSGQVLRSNEPLATLATYRRVKVSMIAYSNLACWFISFLSKP